MLVVRFAEMTCKTSGQCESMRTCSCGHAVRAPPPQEGVAAVFEEPAAGANGAAAAADHGRALLHDPRVARLGFALQFVIKARPAACCTRL